jgi:hypothetical protein
VLDTGTIRGNGGFLSTDSSRRLVESTTAVDVDGWDTDAK